MKSQTTALFKYGLNDLIAGKTPTFSGWTANPTDAADITDGDITTFCTTGNKIAPGGYQYAIFEWDLGSFYQVICTGVMRTHVTAGSRYIFYEYWDGSAWMRSSGGLNSGGIKIIGAEGALCSKIRIIMGSSLAATITPEIREFNVWRLK